MWTEEEKLYLKKNYPKYGLKYCVEGLSKTKNSIKYHVGKLGLKVDRGVIREKLSKLALERSSNKLDEDFNVNCDKFSNINDPEVSYFLGLLWADGYIYKDSINIYCSSDDINDIKSSLDLIGDWNYYYREARKDNWKPITRVHTNNKRIVKILNDNGYDNKSTHSACLIVNKIPEKLKHYFFRGLVDGDGCFYVKKNDSGLVTQFSLTSTHEQDWAYFSDLLESLEIKFSVRRVINKNGNKYSQIRVTNKVGVLKLGEYLYGGKLFGLSRKYDKFKSIT